jgi:hypothetical protein
LREAGFGLHVWFSSARGRDRSSGGARHSVLRVAAESSLPLVNPAMNLPSPPREHPRFPGPRTAGLAFHLGVRSGGAHGALPLYLSQFLLSPLPQVGLRVVDVEVLVFLCVGVGRG